MRLATRILVLALFLGSTSRAFAAASISPQHDPSCIVPYSATAINSLLFSFAPGEEVDDDLHLTTSGNAALCAFDVRVKNVSGVANTLTIQFYAGGAADPVPGAVTAGPFVVPIPALVATQNVHFEAGSGYVTPDAYIGIRFDDGLVPVANVTGASVGATHDTWYRQGTGFDDNGANPANWYAVLYVSPPVPVQSETWGAVKAIYR